MRIQTPFFKSGGRRRRQTRRRLALILGALVLVTLVGWLGWKRGFGSRLEGQAVVSALTNTTSAGTMAKAAQLGSIQSKPVTNAVADNATNGNGLARGTALLEAQVALDRLAISPGSIDGVPGSQTRAALRAFQLSEGLPVTGELDTNTRARLTLTAPALAKYRLAETDLTRLLPMAPTWLGKSEQPRLDYENVLECVAERGHAHPAFVRKLNPAVDWMAMSPGTELTVPAAEREAPRAKAAFLRIRLGERTLQAFDATNRLLAHFPCSIAARVEKRPVGELRVTVLVPNPDYMFNPENFPESTEAQELGRKLHINPGPNNPVGTAWIGLNLSGYGIHGTPRPEDVGRTESHGCFRLANWNAEYLLQLVTVGTPVRIEP